MGWIMMAASVQYDVMAITTVTPRIQDKRYAGETGLIAELALRRLSFSLLRSAGHRQHFQNEHASNPSLSLFDIVKVGAFTVGLGQLL